MIFFRKVFDYITPKVTALCGFRTDNLMPNVNNYRQSSITEKILRKAQYSMNTPQLINVATQYEPLIKRLIPIVDYIKLRKINYEKKTNRK